MTTQDIEPWYAYLSVPANLERTSWDLHSAEELLPYVWSTEPRSPFSDLRLAVADRTTDQLVGSIGFHTVSPEHRSAR